MQTETTLAYKADYEAGWFGYKPMTKAQYTAGLSSLVVDWKEYRKGVQDGKEDKLNGYEYNHGHRTQRRE